MILALFGVAGFLLAGVTVAVGVAYAYCREDGDDREAGGTDG